MKRKIDILSLKQELDKNSLVTNIHFQLAPPISNLILEIFQQAFSFSLDVDLQSVYQIANGIRLLWHHEVAGKSLVGGEVDIRGCLDTFVEDTEMLLGCQAYENDEEQNDQFVALCKGMKIFDRYHHSFQSTRLTTLQLAGGRVSRLWLWDSDGDKYPLTLSPMTYLQQMVRSKALLNWQYFYLDTNAMDLKDPFFSQYVYGTTLRGTVATMEEFCSIRSHLFGKKDLTFYQKQLREISTFFHHA